jgi:hypothetical protein
MHPLLDVPEIAALHGNGGLIRIPNQIDVPVTRRVLRIIDSSPFQRLKKISQLGLVSFVYPAANHSRFEHSLGVYRNSLLFLRQLGNHPRFCQLVSPADAQLLIVAALLHDVGHWPFCHPIEDLELEGIPSHERIAERILLGPELADCLRTDWQMDPQRVVNLITRQCQTTTEKILASILSGPIDIDKMDYLYRDSLHSGVPYGQNFDSHRLVRSLTLNRDQNGLAITHKGKTAAELMVFARYVMFSEVYWHPTVRSATAMFQRAFYLWYQAQLESSGGADRERLVRKVFQQTEGDFIAQLKRDSLATPWEGLVKGLFGDRRQLYKRIVSFSFVEQQQIYSQMAHRPYSWLVACGERLRQALNRMLADPLPPQGLLIDAPPVGLEVQFNVDVHFPGEDRYARLGEISPVVQVLAQRQFDNFVKQIRIFVAPETHSSLKQIDQIESRIREILQEMVTEP